ncbi:hypothetical protein [Gimesia sp.]|uniref:hypothetical protein n=1 Tax=Gimesia sp. TaxID=2024833 RepID=UPI000C53EC38|nr:hypothetical protein [Gimesia sp.]MAX35330.1 hypothetical protein [Gimesia sp.]HBL48274.1 hypothetical protein [Planctomycetaceae bacterium]|tara:strand:+ start:2002 stop:2958 length:957 start_codon:yes stop_codon:yes gene_type:complete
MSHSMLEEPQTESAHSTASIRLQSTMAAARLSFTWLGVRKSLTAPQKSQAADSFGAEGKFLSAGKKLLDTSHPAFKAVTAVRGRAVAYWKGVSLPYPEPGIRLIKQSDIHEFDRRLAGFRDELNEAVTDLNRHFDELRSAARNRLGELFNPTDYPHSLIGMFDIEHDYPAVEPPRYLQQLSPELYEQECRRMQLRFDEAVQLAEQAFLEELTKLVEHLTDRLSGQSDGKPKVFRDTAITNLTDFFVRFQTLNVRSNEQLDDLVDQAQQIVGGLKPQQLRDNGTLRQQVATQLAGVQSSLDGLLIDRPRRNILRRPQEG